MNVYHVDVVGLVLIDVVLVVVFSRVLRECTPLFVDWSVRPSVCPPIHLSVIPLLF